MNKKTKLKQEKKEKIIRIRKNTFRNVGRTKKSNRRKIWYRYSRRSLINSTQPMFLVAQLALLDASRSGSELNFTVVGGFRQWRKAVVLSVKVNTGF
jgi:hypothetical protein